MRVNRHTDDTRFRSLQNAVASDAKYFAVRDDTTHAYPRIGKPACCTPSKYPYTYSVMDRCPPALLRGFSAQDRARVRGAHAFAHTHLSAAIRRTGESYAVHGCEVAETLREISDDPALIAAAILHSGCG